MLSEPFAIGDSLIHRLDPRVRVIMATVYSFVVALSDKFTVLSAALAVSLLMVFIARLELPALAKRILIVNGLVLLVWVVLPFTFEGQSLMSVGPLVIYRPGVLLAARITIKSNAILLAFIALIATMNFSTLGHALNRLRLPDKIVQLLLMTYRYIFVIEQEYQRLMRAARIRGFQPGTNLHTYKTYAYVIGMLFVRAAARAERVHQAMLCRGFKQKFYCLQEFKTGTAGHIFSALMLIVVTGLIFLEHTK
jgi:cobalt/nickel transport system permease protein